MVVRWSQAENEAIIRAVKHLKLEQQCSLASIGNAVVEQVKLESGIVSDRNADSWTSKVRRTVMACRALCIAE